MPSKAAKATKTSRKTAGLSQAALVEHLEKSAKAKASLLEQAATLGLLDSDETERLEGRLEAILEGSSLEPTELINWDRAMARGLAGVKGEGSRGKAEKTWAALQVWQTQVARLSADRAGITAALEGLRSVLPAGGMTLFLRDEATERVVPMVTVGVEVELISRIRFAEGMGFSSWVATRKKPVLYTSLHRNEAPDPERMHSFISVPLVIADTCVGVLNLGHPEDGFYTQNELRTAVTASGALAALVQRVIALSEIATREITDVRTGFATPVYFRRRLEEEVTRCRELGHSMSLAILRLEEWDALTAQYGPEFEDRAGVDLGVVVQGWVRPTELVGELAPGTVAVVFPSARAERATSRAGELAGLLQRHNFPRRKRMTATWGVAAYPADAEDSQGLLRAADKSSQKDDRTVSGSASPVHTMATP